MSVVRFYGDPHFSHKWMATHRGFQDEFYHDEHIIDTWNSVVNKKDTTYILGDITLEKHTPYPLLDRLLGRKIVVLGNHDPRQYVKQLLEHVDHVAGCIMYKGYFLTHIPIHPGEFEYRDIKGNIHAHTHERIITDDYRYICVSAEIIKYKPITLDQVNAIFDKNKLKTT